MSLVEELPPADPRADEAAAACPQSGLKALAAVARHMGLDWSLLRLMHVHGKDVEPDAAHLVRIAQAEGLQASVQRLDWTRLSRFQKLTPFLAPMDNGGWFVVLKVGDAARGENGEDQILLFNPKVPEANLFAVSRADFTAHWTGEIVLLKRVYKLDDTNRRFGLGWFVPEIWRQRALLRNVVIAALAMHVLALAVPIFFQIVIDRVLIYLSISTLVVIGIGVVLAILFDSTFSWLRGYFVLRTASRIDIRLARTTFRHLMSLPISYFDGAAGRRHHQAYAAGLADPRIPHRQAAVHPARPAGAGDLPAADDVVQCAPDAGGDGGDRAAGLVIAVMLGPYRRRLRKLYQAEAQRQSLLVESVHGMRTVKSLNLEPRREEAWDNAAAEAVRTYVQVGKISLAANTFSSFIEKALTITIVVAGAFLVFSGHLTVGGLVAFNMLSSRVISPVLQMIGLLNNYQEVMMSVEMLGEIMNRPGENSGQRGLTPAYHRRHPLRPRHVPLSRQRAAGAEGCIAAHSRRQHGGHRRAAAARARPRCRRCCRACIMPAKAPSALTAIISAISTWAICAARPAWCRRSRSCSAARSRTISAWACPLPSFEDVVEAARQAGADDFIQDLPKRYDTELEESAVNLSGGQKQRLSIARALLRQPRVIIFDEATSALDPESEAVVVKNLKQIARGRTTIVISHRLQTIRDADRIIVIDAGSINDVGTHDELIGRNFVYRQLWQQQHARQA